MTTKYTQEELNQTGIYAIIHRESGKLYIGSAGNSFKQRWNLHKRQLRKGQHHSRYLQRAWNKYSEFAFEFKILEFIREELIFEWLIKREQWWIDLFASYENRRGYNISPTAGSLLGYKHSEETRKKISEALKGENSPNWGKTFSEETRKKISEARKGKTNRAKTYTFLSPEGKVVSITNLKAFCRKNNLNQSGMCRVYKGERNYHKGWRAA